MNGYELSRQWFDWSFENPEKSSPVHAAVYFFAIEHCNRLGWKSKFGFPTTMAMEAIGIKSYNTYIKIFNDLIDWNFFILIEKSRNQYSSNIIALSNIDKALNKALDKALTKHLTKHLTKQGESTPQSNGSINKPLTNNNYRKTLLSKINISDYPALNPKYIDIAKGFYALFEKNLLEAGATTANLKKAKGTWIDDVRLMIEKDGYTILALQDIYKFLQVDKFWKSNILSISKIREQIDKLKLKIKSNETPVGNSKEATSWNELAAIIEKHTNNEE